MITESQHQKVETEEISLKELLLKLGTLYRYLVSKWLIILIFGALGGIVGYVFAYLNKVSYTATTTFVLEGGESGGGLGQYSGIASMVGIDIGGGNSGEGLFQGENIIELYKSRRMIQKTLLSKVSIDGKEQMLIDKYIQFNGMRDSWKEIPELKNIQFVERSKPDNIQFSRLQDSLLGKITNDINLNYLTVMKLDKKLSIIKVSVKAENESFAKNFNEQIVKNVNDFYIQTRTKKALENVVLLQQKTDSVRAVMNGSIYTAAVISDATPNLNPTRQVQRQAPLQKAQFSAETNKAMLAELVKNLELSKITLHKETPLIQVVDEPIYPLEKHKLSKLKAMFIGAILLSLIAALGLTMKKILNSILS
ncbi:lipopolysaccharide biosynthesis protein [Pedobacter sp.]|uniref:lipopolysaccharide biosynthesis protein n=1 Tax=Pedobacter sp. TaxID=1411316 RepID=UPI003D7F5302